MAHDLKSSLICIGPRTFSKSCFFQVFEFRFRDVLTIMMASVIAASMAPLSSGGALVLVIVACAAAFLRGGVLASAFLAPVDSCGGV